MRKVSSHCNKAAPFRMIVRDVFTFSDGRTVFAGEIADGPDYIPESDCDLRIDGLKATEFKIEGEMLPLGKKAADLRAISTTAKLDTDLVRSSLAAGRRTVEIVTRFFVIHAVADQWTGVFCTEEEKARPTFEDVRRWIDRLDAQTWRTIVATSNSGSTLTVGGGQGQYVVIMTPAEEEFWNLLRSTAENEGEVQINIGGQEGDYPRRQVVDYSKALKATETFFSTGAMDPTLDWEQQK